MSARTLVRWASLLLAIIGWAGALWSYLDHGVSAGVHPGFITALTVACTFSICYAVTVVMPDQARIYALGYSDGLICTTCPIRKASDPEAVVRHLTSV